MFNKQSLTGQNPRPLLVTVCHWLKCKVRFCSSTIFVQTEQKWLATATEIVVLTKMVAISTDFVHFGPKMVSDVDVVCSEVCH